MADEKPKQLKKSRKRRASRKRRKLDARGMPIISPATARQVNRIIGARRPGRPAFKYHDGLGQEMIDYFQAGLDALVDPLLVTTDKGAKSYLNKPIRPVTFAGFAAQIGVSRRTIWLWKETHEIFADAHARSETIYEQILLEMGTMGGWNQRMAEFLLKNHHGYKDKAEIETTGKIQLVIDEQDARHFDPK